MTEPAQWDAYTRQRFDRLVEDTAVTRNKVEAIEQHLLHLKRRSEAQSQRLAQAERRIFALWVIGPALLGAGLFLQSVKAWLLGR